MSDYEDLSEKIIAQSTVEIEGDDPNGELLEILLNTREQGQMMEQLIKNQIEVKDAADRFTDQLMKAVIKVRKAMTRLVTSDKWQEMTADDLRREYQYSLEDITDLLEQQNVDPFSSEPGDDFDASIHQAKIEATNDVSLDKKVKESISEGYKKGSKVLIPERVIVYQYKA